MTTPSIPFNEFPKISRLSRECWVSEKIDGTNATILIKGKEIFAGSKNRWVTPENDNYGFAKWVNDNREPLMGLGDGIHRGEWWGQGIQRNYGLKEKRLSLFNVSRWCLAGETPRRLVYADPRIEKYQDVLPACVGLVPVLYRGMFTTNAVEGALVELRMCGSKAAPGFMKPEGVVCFHTAANAGFKKTLEHDEVPKSLAK